MFVAMQALGIVQSRAGIYTLTLLATQTEVGYFSAVVRFTIALRILPGALFTVLLPRFVRSQDSETLGKALLAGALIGTLGSVVLYAAADGLIWLVYGERFAHLTPILRLVAWLFLLQTLLNILEPYLLAHKAERFVNGTLALSLFAFAGICVLLPVNTAQMAAVMSLGLECVLVIIYGIKSLTLLPQKNPLDT
jgi:O-antigen/teichoic acid export membrane protein